MSSDNAAAVKRRTRSRAQGFRRLDRCGTPDGVFTDFSVGVSYRGRELADTVRNYGTAFSDMHRELYRIYADGNVVMVQLALQGPHDGPLPLPFGTLPPTGKRMDAPCCDVFEMEDGKIKRFDCYPEGSIVFARLGVLTDLQASLP